MTYYMRSDQEIRGVSYFWRILETTFPPHVKEAVKGMRLCADHRGVVFDLPSDLQSIVQVCVQNFKYSNECNELFLVTMGQFIYIHM